jgi:hypothetical protein
LLEKAKSIIDKENLPYREKIDSIIANTLQNTIEVFGCVIPETENHYIIKCPIRIRNSYGFGVSPSIIRKNPKCSICGKNPTDPEQCIHIEGVNYNGEVCRIIFENISLDHIAIVKRPKDPRCVPEKVFIRKEDMNKTFSKEEMEIKERERNPLYCHLCQKMEIKPDIDLPTFFDLQKIDEHDEKSSKSSKEMIISGPLLFTDSK